MSRVHNLIRLETYRTEADLCEADFCAPDKVLVDFFLLLYEWNEKAETTNEAIQEDLQSESH
jgi:hypothetical protein